MSGAAEAAEGENIDYETAKRLARTGNPAQRRLVAASQAIRPELLYYLARDHEPDVRREVASNALTPRQADLLLASDADISVRSGLAGKLARLVPDLPPDRLSQIERMTVDILNTLARDQATEVRRVLSDALKDVPNAPRSVINRLARDVELSVAGPVLRHSPILTDEDLLEIIVGSPIAGALSAIAGRPHVGEMIADAIVAANDSEAMTVLLGNPSAQIREQTLDRIIDEAPRHEPWHDPLVRRPKLPARAAARLAEFVSESLVHALLARTDLDADVAREIGATVRRRLNPAQVQAPTAAPLSRPSPAAPQAEVVPLGFEEPVREEEPPRESALDRAQRLARNKGLTEDALSIALGEGDRPLVVAGLAVLSGIDLAVVDRIISARSARAITALVWKSGLSMRFARQVQLRVAQIPPRNVLNARDGADFPLSEAEMRWQLEFFLDTR